jgi:hypothetical protein
MASYVVHSVGSDDPQPFKHFERFEVAVTHAKQQVDEGVADRADIYEVQTSDARASVAAVRMGDAKFVQSRSRHATDAEAAEGSNRAWERAQKEGPEAVLKFLGLI